MSLIGTFAKKYVVFLNDLVQAISDEAAKRLPDFLKKPGFAIAYSDTTNRHMLYLISRTNKSKMIINGKEIQHHGQNEYILVTIRGTKSLERFLFPNISEGILEATITVNIPHTVLDGLAFANREYNAKYWSEAKFFRMTATDVPFRVTKTGSLLGLDLLHGFEFDGIRHENLIEFVRVFGSEDMIPIGGDAIKDTAFRDFFIVAAPATKVVSVGTAGMVPDGDSSAAAPKAEAGPNWSFTKFLRDLEGSVKQNVLLVGPYKGDSDEDFNRLREVLGSFGYDGFLLKESPDLPIQSNLEKSFAGIMCSCFVIVVDTEPSGHLVEVHEFLSKRFRPVIVIRHEAHPASSFLEDRILTDDYFRVAIISEISEKELLPHILWAKDKVSTQIERFNRINYWREPAR